MIQIKFRAWDKKEKKMHNPAMMWGDNGNWEVLDTTIGKTVIMQFTGCKDKNGKEIYDGDILHHKWEGDIMSHGGEEIFVVEQDKTADYLSFACLAAKWSWQIEVIGNIYENPKLTKRQV